MSQHHPLNKNFNRDITATRVLVIGGYIRGDRFFYWVVEMMDRENTERIFLAILVPLPSD